MSVARTPHALQRHRLRPGDPGGPAIDLATIPQAELDAYHRLCREQAQSGRALVCMPGGRRIPALMQYPRRIELHCDGCNIDLGAATALDIYVRVAGTDVTFRCHPCDLAERCGAEVG